MQENPYRTALLFIPAITGIVQINSYLRGRAQGGMALAKYPVNPVNNFEQRKGCTVGINFYPNRKKMSREIGLCIVLKRQDVLESFCSSCIYQIFENAQVRECFACEVRQGMNSIGQDGKKNMPADDPGSPEGAAAGSGPPVADGEEVMNDRGDFAGRLVDYSKAMLVTSVLLCTFFFGSASASTSFAPADAVLSGPAGGSGNARAKILSVLESRTMDRTVLSKAAHKLSAMEGRRLRILFSLCDRISGDANTAGADIAFSLMTMMIVLS
jgi:hypothetical protein